MVVPATDNLPGILYGFTNSSKNIGVILNLVQGKRSNMVKIKYFVEVLSSGERYYNL
jgi:hypothetical protein